MMYITPKRAVNLLTWTWSLQQSTLAPNLALVLTTPWTNPVLPKYRPQAQQTRTSYSGFDTFRGAPGQAITYVLPNPELGKPFPVSLRTHIQTPKAYLLPSPVGRQLDWPNPNLGKAWPSDLKTFTHSVLPYLLPAPIGRLLDWPNPRGYTPGISLRTWADPLKLTLKGKDIFFGLAGHPNFDWPNPTLAKGPPNKGNAYANVLAQNTPPAPPADTIVHSIPFLATMGKMTAR